MNLNADGKIGLGKEIDAMVLAASWSVFGSLFETVRTPRGNFWAWVLLTSMLSMISLSAIGYFDRYTPQPELTGVLSLLVALPFSAFCSKWLIIIITGLPMIEYPEALRASVWVAIVFELSQWVMFRTRRMMGRRWALVTCVLPEELDELQAQLEQFRSSEWIEIRPANHSRHNGLELHGDETLVISRGAAHHLKHHPQLLTAHLRGQSIVDVHQLLKEFRGRVTLHNSDAWTFLLGSTRQGFLNRFYFHLKALLEPLLALLLIIFLSPVWLAIALILYWANGRPILYCQERLGYRGEKFLLFKFRTMTLSAENDGPRWASKDDPRITPLGRWLRKSRLDELPQLLNVFRRELSFVGPRPERPEFYSLLSKRIPLFSLRLLVRPGITGWAQVKQGYAASVEECETKLEYDMYYVQNMSPRLDLRAMVSTLALMMKGNSGQ